MKKVVNVMVAVVMVCMAAVVMVCMAAVMGMSIKQSIDWQAKYNAEHVKYNEAEHVIGHYKTQESMRVFDTYAIERWCGSEVSQGKVRMLGAKVVGIEDALYTLEDEAGELWLVDSVALDSTDNVLLWIADNDTVNDTTDDVVIKVFIEAHN